MGVRWAAAPLSAPRDEAPTFADVMSIKELPEVDTPIARIVYTAIDRVEVRFKPGVRFTPESMGAMMQARQELGTGGKHRVLMLMPEEIDFDPSMVRTDFYAEHPQPNTEAMAWLAHNNADALITRMILKKSSPTCAWEVFQDEAEARAWLESVVP